MIGQALTLLLVDEDQDFAWLVERLIQRMKQPFFFLHEETVEAAVQTARELKPIDVVIATLDSRSRTDLDKIQQLRDVDQSMPLIVLSDREASQSARRTLQVGVQDYFVKTDLTCDALERGIVNAIERQQAKVENERLIKCLQKQTVELDHQNTRLTELVAAAHRFVDNVSHEFRTPLTVIREYSSLIRDGVVGPLTQQQQEFLDVITYRCDDLNTMVDDMLDSSKLDADIMSVHRDTAQPIELVTSSITGLELKAKMRGVEIQLSPSESLPEVFCDGEKIRRVITNLVSNAIKFCDETEGQILITTRLSDDGRDVEFAVQDNGDGIDEEELQFLFKRFRQLGHNTQTSTKGFGLGLNIARELVDLNFGEIMVDSTLGEGTTFSFTVPVNHWDEIVRRHSLRACRDKPETGILVMQVSADRTDNATKLSRLDAFWRYCERNTDLIRRSGPGQWRLLVPGNRSTFPSVVDRFQEEHRSIRRNRPDLLPDLSYELVGCFDANREMDQILQAATASDQSTPLPAPHFRPSGNLIPQTSQNTNEAPA